MIGGMVEITEEGRYLSLFRGFLKISTREGELAKVPLDQIDLLLISAHSANLSTNLMAALAERHITTLTIGPNWHPKTITLSMDSHHQGAGILQKQIALSTPKANQLWRYLVQQKILNQALILEHCARCQSGTSQSPDPKADSDSAKGPAKGRAQELRMMAQQVKSGDPDNREAQAARLYWPSLFGADFRRSDDISDANSLLNGYLNYGYAVLRAATARAVVGAGLTPGLGIFHKNKYNNFALVDDLMEPYRPLIDRSVWQWQQKQQAEKDRLTPLDAEAKRHLVAILRYDLISTRGMSPLVNCLHGLAQSFVRCLDQKNASLDCAQLPKNGELFA